MIKVVLLKKMKMVEMILMGVMAFLVAVRWFLMLTIKQNITKKNTNTITPIHIKNKYF